jgi:DNA-binding NtrC family response regulator
MNTQIFVVDDESDVELLIQQKCRHLTRESLATVCLSAMVSMPCAKLKANAAIDMVVTGINMLRMTGCRRYRS